MKKEPEKKNNTMEMIRKKAWEGVKTVSVKVVRFSFWEMAFLAFLLRLLVTPPFGAALALAAGSLWLYRNFAAVKGAAKNALAYLIELSEEEQEEYEASLWFRGSGRDEIQAVIGELSNHKINACDLVQQIEDFPPEDQWDALKKEVRSLQVLPQTTDTAFYITWALPFLPTSRSPSGMVTPSVPRRGGIRRTLVPQRFLYPAAPDRGHQSQRHLGGKRRLFRVLRQGLLPFRGTPSPFRARLSPGIRRECRALLSRGIPSRLPKLRRGRGTRCRPGLPPFRTAWQRQGASYLPSCSGMDREAELRRS